MGAVTGGGITVAGRYRIRSATPAEIETLREIERAAGECFRGIGMPEVADDEPLPAQVLAGYQHAGRALVAVHDVHGVAAYLIHDTVDGSLHIEQVSVRPDHARRGLGRALIDGAERAEPWTEAVTLTTFRDVPWNAPYYARCGFRILDETEWTPGLRDLRQHEAAHGMDRWPRVCMRRESSRSRRPTGRTPAVGPA